MVVHMRYWMRKSLRISVRVNTPVLHIFYVHVIEVYSVGVWLLAILAHLCSSLIKCEQISSINITQLCFYKVCDLIPVGLLFKPQDLFWVRLILNDIGLIDRFLKSKLFFFLLAFWSFDVF